MNIPDTLPLQKEEKKYTPKRLLLMLVGILLIGMCVASYRISGFGVPA